MTPSRYVWLSPRDRRRDTGPLVDPVPRDDGTAAELRYERRTGRRLALVSAALGAGIVFVAPLAIFLSPAAALAAMATGAVYVAALRLVLVARARDRTLGHHGAFLPRLSRLRSGQVRRSPESAATRLQLALAARHDSDDAADVIAAAALRAVVPVMVATWLGHGGVPIAIAAGIALLAGLGIERRRTKAITRATLARTRFARLADRFVAAWPTLRDMGAGNARLATLRRAAPLAAEAGLLRSTLGVNALSHLGIPALATLALVFADTNYFVAVAALLVAVAAAAQAGLRIGRASVLWAVARHRRRLADRLFVPSPPLSPPLQRIDTIAADALSFRYPGAAAPAFEAVDFVLRRGEVLALNSPSGSGKTTLLRVLTGLADPSGGRVLVNGTNARGVAYRHRITAVFQDEPIGSSTIRTALAGGSAMTLDQAWAAAARVGADTLIQALPMQMQTLIVEGPFPSSLLQPLLIARAVAQHPDLLILDEALSALTVPQAETLLNDLRAEGMLVIFASHDPHLVALADRSFDLSG